MKLDAWDWLTFFGMVVLAAGLYVAFGTGTALITIGAALMLVGLIGANTQARR